MGLSIGFIILSIILFPVLISERCIGYTAAYLLKFIFICISIYTISSYICNCKKYLIFMLNMIDQKIATISFEKGELLQNMDQDLVDYHKKINPPEKSSEEGENDTRKHMINFIIHKLSIIKEENANPFLYKNAIPFFALYISILSILSSSFKYEDTHIFIPYVISFMMLYLLWTLVPELLKSLKIKYKDSSYEEKSYTKALEIRLIYMDLLKNVQDEIQK